MSTSSSDISDSDISSGSEVSKGSGNNFNVDQFDPDDVDSDGLISDSEGEEDSTGRSRGPQISEIDSQEMSDPDFSEKDGDDLEGDAGKNESSPTKSAISEIDSGGISDGSSDNEDEMSDSIEEADKEKKRPSVAAAAPASPTKKKKATDEDEDFSSSSDDISVEEKNAAPASKSAFGSYSDISEYSEELSFSSVEDRPAKAKAKPVPVIRDPAIIGSSPHKPVPQPEEATPAPVSPPEVAPMSPPEVAPVTVPPPEVAPAPVPPPEVAPVIVTVSEPGPSPTPVPEPEPTPASVPASPKKTKQSPPSSDSDSSTAPKPAASPKKKSVLDSSSDSSSSDDSSTKKKKTAPAVKKKSFFDDSDSDQSSDYSTDSSDERAKKAKAKAKEPPPKPKVSLSDLKQGCMTEEERKAKVAEAAAGLWDFKRPEELVFDDEPKMTDSIGMADFFIPPPPPVLLFDPDLPDEIESSFAPPPPPVLMSDPDLPEEIESNIDEMLAEEEVKAAQKAATLVVGNDQAASTDPPSMQKDEQKKKKKKSFLDSSSSDEDSSSSSEKSSKGKKKPASPKKKKKSFLDSSSDEDSSGDTSASFRKKKATIQPDLKKKSTNPSDSDSDMEETDDINSVMSDSRPHNVNDAGMEVAAPDPAIEPVLLHSEKRTETHHSVARHRRSSVNIDDGQSNRCSACEQRLEFCPDGLFPCSECQKAFYCSQDCARWHFERGGHDKFCQGGPDVREMVVTGAKESDEQDSEKSVDLFSGDPADDSPPVEQVGVMAALAKARAETAKTKEETQPGLRCKACGMDQEFVPEGMTKCPYCSDASYCSADCMRWDWASGGHMQVCQGATKADQNQVIQEKPNSSPSSGSESSIVAFEVKDDLNEGELQSQEGILAALAASRSEAASKNASPAVKVNVPWDKCKACGIDKEFVPDGMKTCSHCSQVPYCSDDCMQWDWETGGHRKVCPGAPMEARNVDTTKSRDVVITDVSEESIKPFATDKGDQYVPQSREGILAALSAARTESATKISVPKLQPMVPQDKCRACGMDKEIVPDGMLMCQHCNQIPYCCGDCMQWDWETGGHAAVCSGAGRTDTMPEHKSRDIVIADGSDGSIEAFAADADEQDVPQSKESILAALSAARAETAVPRVHDAPVNKPSIPLDKCKACHMEKEFVPDGMIPCTYCSKVAYCSQDCLEWDWEGGGHKQACKGGVSEAVKGLDGKGKAAADSDEDSIEAVNTFDDEKGSEAPQSKEGILAAIKSARTENVNDSSSANSPHRDQTRQLDFSAQATKVTSGTGSAFPDNGGVVNQQEKFSAVTVQSHSTIPATSQSLRDQITGGTDPQQQIELYAQPKSHGYDVNVIKLELERTKRQYNEAMLSKATLERSLKETESNLSQGLVPPTPHPPDATQTKSCEAFAAFLDRAKGFLLNSGHWPPVKSQAIAEQQTNLLLQAGLGESIIEFEKSIEAYASKHNELLGEKQAFQKAYEESEAELKVLRQELAEAKATKMVRDSNAQVRGMSRGEDIGLWETLASTIAENRSLREDLDTAKKEHEKICRERETIERLLKEKEALLSKLCEAVVTLEGRVSHQEGQNKSLNGELDRTESLIEDLRAEKTALEKSLKDSELEIDVLRRSILSLSTNKETTTNHTMNNIRAAESVTIESENGNGGSGQSHKQREAQPAYENNDKAKSASPTLRTNHMTSNFRSPSSMLAQSFVNSEQAKRERIGLSPPQQREGLRDPGGKRLSEGYDRVSGKWQGAHPRLLDPSVSSARNSVNEQFDQSGSHNNAASSQRLERTNGSKKYNRPSDFGTIQHGERALPDPIANKKSDIELSLSPAERRMVFIQQQIANAVKSAKHSASPSPSSYRRKYGRQGASGANSKSPLRPRYKEPSSAPPATQNFRSHYQDPKMVDRLAMPSLTQDRHQTPRGYPAVPQNAVRHRPYVQLPRAPLPSYNHTVRVPSRSLAPGGTSQFENKATTSSSHKIKAPRTKNGAPHQQNKPRLFMMEEVDLGVRAEKDDRWKHVLKSSRVLN